MCVSCSVLLTGQIGSQDRGPLGSGLKPIVGSPSKHSSGSSPPAYSLVSGRPSTKDHLKRGRSSRLKFYAEEWLPRAEQLTGAGSTGGGLLNSLKLVAPPKMPFLPSPRLPPVQAPLPSRLLGSRSAAFREGALTERRSAAFTKEAGPGFAHHFRSLLPQPSFSAPRSERVASMSGRTGRSSGKDM